MRKSSPPISASPKKKWRRPKPRPGYDSPLLSVRGVKTFYGRVMALKGVDLDVNDGEIVTLIGANGAGKSTLMMTICGDPRAREGTIRFADRDITALPTHEIARLGSPRRPRAGVFFRA